MAARKKKKVFRTSFIFPVRNFFHSLVPGESDSKALEGRISMYACSSSYNVGICSLPDLDIHFRSGISEIQATDFQGTAFIGSSFSGRSPDNSFFISHFK